MILSLSFKSSFRSREPDRVVHNYMQVNISWDVKVYIVSNVLILLQHHFYI